MTSFFCVVSYCHLSATLQTMSIIVETYNTLEMRFEFLSHFSGFSVDSPSYKRKTVKSPVFHGRLQHQAS